MQPQHEATLTQPLHCDLQRLSCTIELRATASEIVAPKLDLDARAKKGDFEALFKRILEGKSLAPKWRKSADKSLSQPSCSHSNTIYEVQLQKTIVLPMQPQHEATLTQPFTLRERSYSCKAQWNSIGNSSTSNTCNPIYIAGTILELQITMEFPSATHPPAPLAIPFTLRERSYSCKSQWNSVDRTCTKNRWNPIYNAEPIRPWSEHDPPMIRPHTRPSRNRRTAEVDHRGSGTDFVWKNIGFRASAISQKRISCETSFKTPSATPPPAPLAMPFALRERSYTVAKHNGIPSATHPPAPLAIPFTLRERSYGCKSQWNSVDRTCTKNRWNPIYNAEPIRPWSAHDPTTHETVSQPSHRRGRSSRFGDGLCMEKHRVSCICYLSKTHFVRDFLQNSIGNSSTSTTCNAILTLSLTNSFPDILKVTINSVPN